MNFGRALASILLMAALLTPQAHAGMLLAPPRVGASLPAPLDGEDGDQDDRQGQARGIVSGQIIGIDYANGIVRLQTSRGPVDIIVRPGTSIVRGGDEYGTIADLTRGKRVAVYVSQVGGQLVAQIIRIR